MTTVAFEPISRTVQVVCSDLGPDLVEPGDAEAYLDGVWNTAAANHTNLAHLAETAARLDMSTTLTLATGSGRLYRTGNATISKTTFAIPGFTAALTIALS